MSVPPVINYVDFEVLNEPWEVYKLTDNTILRTRSVVAQIVKTGQFDVYGKPVYAVMANVMHSIRAPKELRGEPTLPPLTSQQLGNSIIEEVNASLTGQPQWNIYRCVDGTTIKVQTVLVSVRRTSAFDILGEPMYIISTHHIIKDDVPKTLWAK